MATNKAMVAPSRRERLHHLDTSIKEFDYVIRLAKTDFVLLPEILTKKGQNLIRFNEPAKGIQELQSAIELKPDYWPAYIGISDYYKDAGDPARAREWLERGLVATPEAKPLKRRLAELEGKHKRARDPAESPTKRSGPTVESDAVRETAEPRSGR
jgi:tetratricopeptide (TPR) repeat protein